MKTIPTLSKFYKVKILIEYYSKVILPSGRYKWVLTKTDEPRIIDHEYYNNIILATRWFNHKVWSGDKSRDILKYNDTKAGYLPTRNTSISSCGNKKIIRYFEIIDAESEE